MGVNVIRPDIAGFAVQRSAVSTHQAGQVHFAVLAFQEYCVANMTLDLSLIHI